VANPAGAFLPAGQTQTENKYRRDLQKNGIVLPTGEHCYACTAGSGFT